eukprot:4357964-Pleurochrysis_carterae.AAC.2
MLRSCALRLTARRVAACAAANAKCANSNRDGEGARGSGTGNRSSTLAVVYEQPLPRVRLFSLSYSPMRALCSLPAGSLLPCCAARRPSLCSIATSFLPVLLLRERKLREEQCEGRMESLASSCTSTAM